MNPNIRLLYIDLFCGAGGTTTGVSKAMYNGSRCAYVVACVNHDQNAIASHAANHPATKHFTEDIRTFQLDPMLDNLSYARKKYPSAKVVLWASLECTNFSKAKGGLPRDADSRTLADHLFRYIEAIDPDYIQIENVEEFMSWGDLDENGKPLSRDKGRCYMRWVNKVKRYGYDYQYRLLNSANYGAYTSRTRFFGQFARHGLPIVFPEATHARNVDMTPSLFENHLQPWRPVREVLDLSDVGLSIFGRNKQLCEKTLERIYAGLVKFASSGRSSYLLKYNSVNGKTGTHVPPSVDEPCPTVACQNRLGVVNVKFLSKQFSGNPKDKNVSIDAPAGTITTKDHHMLVDVRFFDMQYGNGTPSSVERPANTITANPKLNLVTAQYLLNPQYQSKGGSINDPCFTLIAHMDKTPPYLISTKQGLCIEIYDTDSPMTVKIKEFMAHHGIADVCMRMLSVKELKLIMGFPSDYMLIGTQAEQKKFIGNAVEVGMAKALCESLCMALCS